LTPHPFRLYTIGRWVIPWRMRITPPSSIFIYEGRYEINMATQLETYTRTFTSFSGADIQAVLGNVQIMEMQGVSYSVTREKV